MGEEAEIDEAMYIGVCGAEVRHGIWSRSSPPPCLTDGALQGL